MATSLVVRSADELRSELAAARQRGLSVGFVPTMGALHAGHQALIERSAAGNGLTVVSVFVNPAQFDDPADLASYPRSEQADVEMASEAGAGICFLPDAGEIYPPGHATSVSMRGAVTGVLEGAQRGPGHFDGVCTVLTVLFSLVRPDTAYFGAKDAQQVAVVRRLVRDLGLGLRIEAVPTVREHDGLAMSSRNARLTAAERPAALALSRALAEAGAAIVAGAVDSAAEVQALGLAALERGGATPEYFAAVDPENFEPDEHPDGGTLLLCAARVGDVRLIDNMNAAEAAETGFGFDREREES
ncbi:MAG: pantoate--beta-alanine ligase [Solirubrobacterales bacterium]